MEQVPETVPVPETFQVFINHRGPDVKKTLASLIYHRLTNCGLSVFLDKDEIRTGDSISFAISTAIHSASLHIAIFSEGYAESSWCLDELYWILRSYHKRRAKIIPVFSDVEPKDLRHIESGCYAKAFENHRLKGRVAIEVIQKWKTALAEASHISGLRFKTKESDYGEFLEKIVTTVVEEVFKLERPEAPKYSVGLHQAAEDFQNEIMKHRDPIVVGIAGMVGVGKSTLARYLYGLKRSGFTRSSFLCDVRERDLLCLQKKLLCDLLGHHFNHIDNPYDGKRILRDCQRRLPKIFVVLDDVDHMHQIDGLIDTNDVPSGSLILITSRDKDLLRRSSARSIVYDVKPLHKNHARELFCRHAFPESKPSEELEGLVEEFVKICGGLPLSLKVFGGVFLAQSDNNIEYWKRQLEKFSTTLPYDIINPLKLCYDALDPVEKEVFLDIGCFFVGEEQELAILVLEGLYENNKIGDYLESIHQKCLVDVHRDGHGSVKITMHNQLRKLARHIAREEFRGFPTPQPLRLSCSDDMQEILRSQAGSLLRIRGIRSSEGQETPNFVNKIRVEGMHLFVIEGFKRVSSIFDWWDISGDLVWLRLRNVTSFNFPRSISLRRLRVLEIEGKGKYVEALFDNFDQDLPSHLHELNIVGSDKHISGGKPPSMFRSDKSLPGPPSNFGSDKGLSGQRPSSIFRVLGCNGNGVRTLTKLVLRNLAFLQSIPIEFSQLQNLRHLDLCGSSNLTQLPNTFSHLLQLQYLSLRGCISLSIPPDILGEISTLEYVDFKGCHKLVALPLGIPNQTHLRYLNLLRTGLLQLPVNLGILDHLEQLEIGSPELKELPVSLANLRGLTELTLSGCAGVRRMSLEEIKAPNLKYLAIIESPIAHFIFQDQESLDVDQNIHLKIGTSVLRDFTLNWTSISEICIPEGVLSSLETMDLSLNSLLTKVNALPSALVKLDLSFCQELKTLTTLSNLANLKFLDVSNCDKLETLNVGGLILLQEIQAKRCWKLKRIEALSKCGSLNCLNISTNTQFIWNDICDFLTSPYHQKLSTASITGLADVRWMLDEEEVRCILGRFKTKMVDMVSGMISVSATTFHFRVKLENFHSLSGILLCFITYVDRASSSCFRVAFRARNYIYNYGGPDHEYRTFRGKAEGRRLHIFLWTQDSKLFTDYKVHSDIDVYCLGRVTEPMDWGRIVMIDKGEDVFQVCKEIIIAFA